MADIPWLEISRISLLSQALLISVYAAVFTPGTSFGRMLLVFGLCAAGEILLRFYWDGWHLGWLYYLAVVGASSLPAVVWLGVQYVFDDDFHADWRFWTIVLAYLTLNLLGRLGYDKGLSVSLAERLLIFYLPQCIKLGFALHIIYIALRGLQTDLVEHRRQLRAPVALVSGLIVAGVLTWQLVKQSYQIGLHPWLETGTNLLIGFGTCLGIFRFRFQVAPAAPAITAVTRDPATHAAPDSLVARLHSLMAGQQVFLQPGLTISALAEKLGVPEYRLRRTINGELGFRNFNQYLNALRIEQAERQLMETDLPVLSIALDLGYQSISSFNKAFREIKQLTPTEFRTQARATVSSH